MNRISSLLSILIKRLTSQKWLAFTSLLGLVISVALVMSIPLYADGTFYRLMLDKLSTRYDWQESDIYQPGEVKMIKARTRPPFGIYFRYTGQIYGAVEWDDVVALDNYLVQHVPDFLGLPQQIMVRFFRTGNYPVWLGESIPPKQPPLSQIQLGFASNLEDNIIIIQGSFPEPSQPGEPILILVHQDFQETTGVQPGDQLIVQTHTIIDPQAQPLQVRVAGVWKAKNPQDAYWFSDPSALVKTWLVPEETFIQRISPVLHKEIYSGVWYLVLDGSRVMARDVPGLLQRFEQIQRKENSLLSHADMDPAITDALRTYQLSADLFVMRTVIIILPILIIVLIFIVMQADLLIGQRSAEISMLRSRGASVWQIASLTMGESLGLSLAAIVLGTPLAVLFAHMMSQAGGFLEFQLDSSLRIQVTAYHLLYGIAILLIAMLVQLIPTLQAAQHTLVNYRQQQARSIRPPWWQRFGLDVMIALLAMYGIFLLRKQIDTGLFTGGRISSSDPLENPLLVFTPALCIFAITLLFLRIIPWIMSLLAWGWSKTRTIGILLASRHLSRTPGFYVTPLLLLVWTLSQSLFTILLAQVMNQNLQDQYRYQAGADVVVTERGKIETIEVVNENDQTITRKLSYWSFPPLSEHLEVPQVRAATRFGVYDCAIRLGQTILPSQFAGIDGMDFSKVAFWRSDFAEQSLDDLLTALAGTPNGVLIPQEIYDQYTLHIGDQLSIIIKTYQKNLQLSVRVVGTFKLFPSWYPEWVNDQGQVVRMPLIVGNLGYIFEQAETQLPYQVWMAVQPETNYNQLINLLLQHQIPIETWRSPELSIQKELQRPERQGLFGILSIAHLITALLSVIGFLYYVFFTIRRRSIELGVLRALGLSTIQLIIFLGSEIAFLLLASAAIGTGMGVWISKLFIPYYQQHTEVTAAIPPVLIQFHWSSVSLMYALFGLVFVIALFGLGVYLIRMRLFEIIKLGEV